MGSLVDVGARIENLSTGSRFTLHKIEMRQGIENRESFLLLVWWETLEDHNIGFRESQAFQEWRAVLGPLFASPPDVVHHAEPL